MFLVLNLYSSSCPRSRSKKSNNPLVEFSIEHEAESIFSILFSHVPACLNISHCSRPRLDCDIVFAGCMKDLFLSQLSLDAVTFKIEIK